MYCADFCHFIEFYGLPILVMAVGMLAIVWRERNHPEPAQRNSISISTAIALTCVMMLMSHFIMDFFDGQLPPDRPELPAKAYVWIKSRLIEPWFYSGIALGFIALWRSSQDRGKHAIFATLIVMIFSRHILSEGMGIIGQFFMNAQYIFHHIV